MSRFFEKISFKQFKKDIGDNKKLYNEIELPKRSTKNSAGYDIKSIEHGIIKPGEARNFKTGLKVCMNSDEVLYIFSRSSYAYKYNVCLMNNVGVIDSDFYNNVGNEGHMWFALQNEGDKTFIIKKGESFGQGIFIKYFVVDDEEDIENVRIGGFGSTNERDG